MDVTAGMGGHLLYLSQRLQRDARLFGIDIDPMAVSAATQALSSSGRAVSIARASYSQIDDVCAEWGVTHFDGILADLGVSSPQLDNESRGFSFRSDAPLDLRFDQSSGRTTAADIIRVDGEKKLADIFFHFGEERQSRKIAKAIVERRRKQEIRTTGELADIVRSVIHPPHENKSLARIFQALRIVVNDELSNLEQSLPKLVSRLKPGGRLGVISYHSLEDRIVKRFCQTQGVSRRKVESRDALPKLADGTLPQFEVITRKPIVPSDEEMARNPRSRSAKMRVMERLAV
jgi:16S rRNA (cytosine1402-N4)-methyltransferase